MTDRGAEGRVLHALSVDVEDWFQVLNMAGVIDRADWDKHELRCVDATRRLLELFDRRGAKATFFFLGWIAERAPDLVREVQASGHEIGSHGYDHQCLPDLGRDGFVEDLRRTNRILEEITGETPRQFRACTWSVTRHSSWAPEVLAGEGFWLDSSVHPVRHPDYGVPKAPLQPFRLQTGAGDLVEFPPLVMEQFGRRLPVGGGGYLRLFPLQILRTALRRRERAGVPGCIYLHPWEVDPEQPRQKLGGLRGFRHYVNLSRTLGKLDRLLQEFHFGGLWASLASAGYLPAEPAAPFQRPDAGAAEEAASCAAKLAAFPDHGLLG